MAEANEEIESNAIDDGCNKEQQGTMAALIHTPLMV